MRCARPSFWRRQGPWVGRERPPTSRVAPGQLCCVAACTRAALLHAGFAAAVAKANEQSSNPRNGELSCLSSSHQTQTRKSQPADSSPKIVSRTRRTACRIYRRQPRIRCDGIRESVAKARPRFPEVVEATQPQCGREMEHSEEARHSDAPTVCLRAPPCLPTWSRMTCIIADRCACWRGSSDSRCQARAAYGTWNWGKLWRECGFTHPR